jgi:aminoglycoside phosphotransferase family enzyme
VGAFVRRARAHAEKAGARQAFVDFGSVDARERNACAEVRFKHRLAAAVERGQRRSQRCDVVHAHAARDVQMQRLPVESMLDRSMLSAVAMTSALPCSPPKLLAD